MEVALENDHLDSVPGYAFSMGHIVVDAQPPSPIGAVGDNPLPAPSTPRPVLPNAYLRPEDPLQGLLAEIWEECLHVRPVGITDNFLELGGDSLIMTRMLIEVEQKTGQKLRPDIMLTKSTIKELAEEILKPLIGAAVAQLVEIQAGQPGRRLFFLHGDYNGAGLYCLNLARHLGSEYGFYTLQPHGFTEPVVPQTIEEMAADHVRTLVAFQPDGPYLLGGHCNGALIALEMAHELVRRGQQVTRLLLIDPPRHLGYSLDSIPYVTKSGPVPNGGQPQRLDLRQLTHEKRRPILLELYRRACCRYHLRPYPGPISIIESLAQATDRGAKVNWEQVAPVVDRAVVPDTNHFTLLTKHVHELAAVLRERLPAGPRG